MIPSISYDVYDQTNSYIFSNQGQQLRKTVIINVNLLICSNEIFFKECASSETAAILKKELNRS